MGKRPMRRYTAEFKQQAVDLALRIGVMQTAEQLGVHLSNIQRWRTEIKKGETKISKQTKINVVEENRILRRENEELKKVNQILKRAAAFFSQDHLK
jgi:transposase